MSNIIIETEYGSKRLYRCIPLFNLNSFYGGDLGISFLYEIENLNIAAYKEIRGNNNNLIRLIL